MPLPVIGLTMDSGDKPDRYGLSALYPESIEKAGGLPFAIPYRTSHSLIPQILDHLDGICFIGGDDMDPALYGETWHPNAIHMDPARQNFELALIAEVERRRIPTLGICFGSQLMNVHRGGSLHQFLPDFQRDNPIEHRKLDRDQPLHPVRVSPDSLLGQTIGQRDIIANTYHKQAMNKIGRGLRVVATAPDGVVEALEDPAFPLFAAVQWHPERLNDKPEHLVLFKLLVEKSSQHKGL
jgi:putative glutamine amidotransferase